MKSCRILIISLVMLGLIPCMVKPVRAQTSTNTTVYLPGMEKNLTTGEINKYYSLGSVTLQRNTRSGIEKLYYLFPDHLLSTRLVVDKEVKETDYLSYYPYGNLKAISLPSSITNLYTGQKQDREVNLYYYHARYYNPTVGHFISADSAQGPNRYAYVGNNPIMRNDPSGNQELPISVQIINSMYAGLKQGWTAVDQDWNYLIGSHGNIGERTVAALDILTFSGLRSATSAVNDYVMINALANQQGLSRFDPARVAVAANAGLQSTSLAADLVGFGQTVRAAPAAIKGLRGYGFSGNMMGKAMSDEEIRLYKGIGDYNGGDILSPAEMGKPSLDLPPVDAYEVYKELLGRGYTPEGLAVEHATYSWPRSPGISFTSDIKIAEEFASRLGGGKGTVVETQLPRSQVFSIPELAKKGRMPGLPGGMEQVLLEQEHIFFGRVPVSKVQVIMSGL